MKHLQKYISEKLIITKDRAKNKYDKYSCQPKGGVELRTILRERLLEDKDADLNDIDVSKITDMSDLFVDLDPHNIDISEWNVSNVITMHKMFYDCENFNCNLCDWDVSNVRYMWGMFHGCTNFKGDDLEKWDISKVIFMNKMFDRCSSLKHVPSWYKK